MYYRKLDNLYVNCSLCPHYCTIGEGDLGKCRVRKNQAGSLYTLNYGKISSYGYDSIEKKPLYHFYPGREIFSIGSIGCNLSCDFCQNHEIVYDSSYARIVEDEVLVDLAGRDDSIGMAFTYNEPSIWYEYMLDLAKKTHEKGLKNVIVTNGYINQDPLGEILPYIDGMNIDLKSSKNSFYKDVCSGSIEPVLKTIEIAAQNTHVEVTTLLIEGVNTSPAEIEYLGKRLAKIDKTIPLHISRYFPAYKMTHPPTTIEVLLESRERLKEYLDHVYIGNVFGIDKNTYCSNCNLKLIDRNTNISKILPIKDNRCINCGKEIKIEFD